MASLVADTHAVIWYLLGSPRLSAFARKQMSATVAEQLPILVPSISLVEMIYLVEKNRIPRSEFERLLSVLSASDSGIKIVPLDEGVARTVALVAWDEIPDMPDRIIAATALYLGLPLISRDGRIRASTIRTIW